MLLGLIADTHDNRTAVARALAEFCARGVTHVLHAGDVTRPGTLALLQGWNAVVIYGNNDRDRPPLAKAAEAAGIALHDGWEGTIAGLSITVLHGDDQRRLKRAITGGHFQLVVTGHSHRLRDEWVGSVRVVNPGALYRAARHTCATYDPRTGNLEVIDVKPVAPTLL